MTVTFGPFLLGRLSEPDDLATLERFANLGLCPMFREIIGERVVEFRYDGQSASYHWLKDTDPHVEALLEIQRSQGGWVPYSYFDYLDGIGTLLIPGETIEGEFSMKLQDYDFVFYAISAYDAINMIAERTSSMVSKTQKSPDHDPSINTLVEFHMDLLKSITKCVNAGVIFRLGE